MNEIKKIKQQYWIYVGITISISILINIFLYQNYLEKENSIIKFIFILGYLGVFFAPLTIICLIISGWLYIQHLNKHIIDVEIAKDKVFIGLLEHEKKKAKNEILRYFISLGVCILYLYLK